MLHCVAVCCSVLQCVVSSLLELMLKKVSPEVLQHTAAHYTTLHRNTLHYTATHYTTLQHTATHCNTLHYAATHCTTQNDYAGDVGVNKKMSIFSPGARAAVAAFWSATGFSLLSLSRALFLSRLLALFFSLSLSQSCSYLSRACALSCARDS